MTISFKKVTSIILIILTVATVGGFSIFKPKPAQAVIPVTDYYEDVLRPIIVSLIRVIYMSAIRPQLADIIAGKSDKPVYVSNPSAYIRDVFTDEVAKKIEEMSGINICAPFKAQLVLSLGASFDRLPYEMPPAPECTAERAWTNIEEGMASLDDFVKISEPQNNFFGAYLIASDNMSKIVDKKLDEETTQLVTGQGFIGVRTTRTKDGKEEEYIRTPGTVVAERVAQSDKTPSEMINASKDPASLMSGIIYDLIDVATGGLTERFYNSAMDYYESKR